MRQPDYRKLHDLACRAEEPLYRDPDTGLMVFTEFELRRRGKCCGTGCRHCPYAHESVPLTDRAMRSQQPTWLTSMSPVAGDVDLLFWSGGKDSFLAYRRLERERRHQIALLTTFDSTSRSVAHQEIEIAQVARQAECLGLPLLGVPLLSPVPYEERIEAALDLVPDARRLVFGDLHLEHIRAWRADHLGELATVRDMDLYFPLWNCSYDSLIKDLEESRVVCEITAVAPEWTHEVEVGQTFNRELVAELPKEIDAFGERGEFHTLAKVWDVSSS